MQYFYQSIATQIKDDILVLITTTKICPSSYTTTSMVIPNFTPNIK